MRSLRAMPAECSPVRQLSKPDPLISPLSLIYIGPACCAKSVGSGLWWAGEGQLEPAEVDKIHILVTVEIEGLAAVGIGSAIGAGEAR